MPALVLVEVYTRLQWAMIPCIHLSLLNRGDSGLPCVIPSIMDSRRAVGVSFCPDFYLLLEWIGDFQAPNLWKQSGSPFGL